MSEKIIKIFIIKIETNSIESANNHGTASCSNASNEQVSLSPPSILIINRKNPIQDNNMMCKQVNRRGRPSKEQVESKKALLRQFLNLVVSNKNKIEEIITNPKSKRIIKEEDIIVTNFNRKI